MSPPRLSLINNLPAIEVQLPMRVKHLKIKLSVGLQDHNVALEGARVCAALNFSDL